MTRTGTRALGVALAALALTVAACGGFSDADPEPAIFERAPWTGTERLTYDLKQRDYVYGRCVLETQPDEENGRLQLNEFCQGVADEQYLDDTTVIVDPETLAPFTSTRTTQNTETGRVTVWSSEYSIAEGVVSFESATTDETHEARRDLPEPTEEVPETAVYDDGSLFWLIRGIPLEDGYQGRYTNVNTSTVTVFNVDVTVEGPETIEVEAGTFEAWKVTVETSRNKNEVWVSVDAPHIIVQANIERFTYELTAIE